MESATPTLDSRFVETLRCPLTQLPLREIRTASLFHANGGAPGVGILPHLNGLDSVLMRSDGLAAYPVRGGIPVLLAEALLPVGVSGQI
jgi:uncharacterized protein YbaR (Trm112 family)